ncbi:unnamed protein product [Vitrella brassicaformis CCMP3155]|uniref:Putative rRNA methyltransferase n=1 Tax=Vitrella brassicaformis (strain CCMP3155) TaxID=1169540 RepID=A0A0G4EA63_VITBC|nr:unnamed protein product [Vitrella brassicaformis CCMP3155]|eukprot:CEL92359.1 unnamed protein product [Vitrella brassicaformis CCMP3155]
MTKKKTGKERLDKWYSLAKDQGYRARSAFKLIQLAKKHDFLSSATVCIDLCAAPGGWMQVAEKNMPVASTIIGVDLVPIKPIKGCATLQADITTAKCRQMLKKELGQQKADVVLHDGAPNVGTSWALDAYAQNELVLQAFKLACEFLKPNGTFITKVFRSSDYNSLLWVFHQLFRRVDATKPQASRAVSAEIYVLCLGFKAPAKIDPKFFDARFVFMDVGDADKNKDDATASEGKGREGAGRTSLADLIKQKGKRNRAGYEEGDDFRTVTVKEFIDSSSPASILVSSHKLLFTSPECDDIRDHELTTDEIRALCDDLKVLGKRDMTHLMKWRLRLVREKEKADRERRKAAKQALVEAEAELQEEGVCPEEEEVDQEDEESADRVDKELEALLESQYRHERAERRKQKEKEKKLAWRKKMSLSAVDKAGGSIDDQELFSLRPETQEALEEAPPDAPDGIYEDEADDVHPDAKAEGEEQDDSDYVTRLEQEMEESHAAQRDEKILRGAKDRSKERATRRQRVTAQWADEMRQFSSQLDMAAERERADQVMQDDSDEDELRHDGSGAGDEDAAAEADVSRDKQHREGMAADRWYSHDLFKSISTEDAGDARVARKRKRSVDDEMGVTDEDGIREVPDEDLPYIPLPEKKKRQLKKKREAAKKAAQQAARRLRGEADGPIDDDKADEFEEVPAEEVVGPKDQDELAEIQALGSLMVHKKSRMDLIDGAYHRYAFDDTALPTWFHEDEQMHNKPELPVSKEYMAQFRQKLKDINSRPIRKVAEAQARKRARAKKRMEKVKKQAQSIAESQELTEGSKARSIEKLMKKARGEERRKPKTYIVSRRSGGGTVAQGKGDGRKSKAAKGNVTVVDRRLKSDKRGRARIDMNRKSKGKKR